MAKIQTRKDQIMRTTSFLLPEHLPLDTELGNRATAVEGDGRQPNSGARSNRSIAFTDSPGRQHLQSSADSS
jgi:hypothetical protein